MKSNMSVSLMRFYITIFVYFIHYADISLSNLVIKEDNNFFIDGSPNKNWKNDPILFDILSNKTMKLRLTKEKIEKLKLWPRGVIPYYIDDFSFDKVLRDRIRAFLEETTDKTGLQFVEMPSPPENNDTRWVFFINRRGLLECADYNNVINFTNEGVQRVILGYDCLGDGGRGALAATVLALVGVPPQHNSPDREDHIEIIYENIIPEKTEFFNIIPSEVWPFENQFTYDFTSAGHYDFYKHTKNGKMTIKPLQKVPTSVVGDAKDLSRTDILKIKLLYKNLSENPKPYIAEDCSKMYKLEKKLNSRKNGSLEDDMVYLKHKSIPRPKFKRGLKAKIEKEMDFDTSVEK